MKAKITLAILVLLIATAATFLPALRGGFTNWDDDKLVTKNPKITGLSPEHVKKIFTTSHFGLYHPLVLLSYATEYRYFGLDPKVYHATNLVLHLANTVAVFWLIYLLGNNTFVAFVTALLFGIHPLHVESVAWISERKDVLYAFFYLGAMIAYLNYLTRRSTALYLLSLSLFLCSLFSKPMAITLPVVLLLCDYLLKREKSAKIILDKIPYAVPACCLAAVTLFSHYPIEEIRKAAAIPLIQKISTAGYGLCFYLAKTFVPVKLSCIYPYPERLAGPFNWTSAVEMGVIILLGLAAVIATRYTRKALFGFLFFCVTLSPVIQFVPFSKAVVGDRFTYIPLIGIFFIAATAFAQLRDTFARRASAATYVLLAAAGITIGTLCYTSWKQCKVWLNSLVLWNDVLAKFPNNAIAHHNRGGAFNELGEYDRAIADFNQALALDPLNANVYNNRGYSHNGKKDLERALADFSKAIEIDPECATAYNNRGNIHNLTGRYDQALADYNKALEFEPDNPGTYNNRGVAHFAKGNDENAIADYTAAITLRPDFAEAYMNRGKVSCKLGALENGIADYSRSVAINPRFAPGYYSRAQAYLSLKEYDKAWEDVQRMYDLGLQPDPQFLQTLEKASGRKKP